MTKKKSACLVIIAFLMVSIIAIAYVPKAFSTTTMHTATVTPTTTILPATELDFNVTNTGGSVINRTSIVLPSNVNYTGVVAPVNATSGWYYVYSPTTNSLDFTGNMSYEIAASAYMWFNITMQWLSVPPGQVVFGVNCSSNLVSSSNNTQWLSVAFTPQFSATITPSPVVKGSTAYLFNITTTNTGAGIGINKINITYPSGWTFNALTGYSPGTWTTGQDQGRNTFYFTGPNLVTGASAWVQVNMTSGSTTQDPSHWNSTAWNIGATWLGTYDLPVVVDPTGPTVTINNPATSYYSVGSGNYIWVNATVTDNLNITKYGMTVAINDTRFGLLSSGKGASDTEYKYYFTNTTTIPDGPLGINVTATDRAGNMGSNTGSTTVDNTAPTLLWIKVKDQTAELPYVAGAFWMSAASTSIQVNASFSNTGAVGTVWFNTTSEAYSNHTWSSTYSVSGSDFVTLNITVSDTSSPVSNRFTQTWNITRDKVPPLVPTFTAGAISGGAIIRSLTATDNVGILSYRAYVNGTQLTPDVLITQLVATALVSQVNWVAFSNVLVLNLTTYGGKVANITITAVDYGGNEGPGSTPQYLSIPLDRWYPIELQPNWNLIGLPLIPADTSRAAVLSLILKQGASGVIVYGYDSATNSFTLNPATMVDGKAYWIYTIAYDVMIVSGRVSPTPPALPPNYNLITGWNLAGYKSITAHNVTDYLSSLPTLSYFAYIYVWDSNAQNWLMKSGSGMLSPGQGFWIWMYSNQTLIPPIP
jgi:hypothetical protein